MLEKSNITLKELQRLLFIEYALYKQGLITESEYLKRIRLIDTKIDKLEWSAIYSSLPCLK